MDQALLWVTLPLVAALIGWFTNFLAVRMIFRPYNVWRLGPLRVQGLLPKRKKEFSASIGATVEDHLISAEDINALIEDPEIGVKLRRAIEERLDSFIKNKLTGGNPMLQAFLSGSMVDSVKEKLLVEVEALLQEGIKLVSGHLDENLSMGAIVEEKILAFDMHKLEEIVLNVAKKELVAIEILGAILGFVVGLVQLAVITLAGA